MTDDQLEFAISQYLDGTLPADQVVALQRRLASDAGARRLLEQYTALNAGLKAQPLPNVGWDAFARQVAQLACVQADARRLPEVDGQALSDEQEFLLTQYLDGELPAEEAKQVEQLLADIPAAQKALVDHRAIGTILKHAWPLPEIHWDRLQQHLCEMVAEEAQASRFRIANWMPTTMRIAVAASVALAIGLAAYLSMNRGGTMPGPAPVQVAQVTVAEPEKASGTASIQISIGPSDDYARGGYDPFTSPLVTSTSRVQVASSYQRAPEGIWLPY